MMESGLSASDVLAMTNNNNNNEIWQNPFIYLVWLAVLGNGGLGLFGNGGNAATQGAITRAELYEGFNNNQVSNDLRGAQKGICDGFYAVNTSLLNGFNGLGNQISENRFAAQQCCCETNRNIDAVRYENANNTCAITGAIHAEGEATRALINSNTMQELRDRLEARDRDLLAAKFQISQQYQNATLIDALKPCPIPAYPVASPYASCGCPCNCGC